MAVLRSEAMASHRSASGLRAGAAAARSLGSSRAGQSCRHSGACSARGPRVARGRGLCPAARAVPNSLASPSGPACAGAQRFGSVGGFTPHGPLAGYGAGIAPGVAFRSNCVFSRTAGDLAVLNQSLLAAAG
jgi:hypothetical protein